MVLTELAIPFNAYSNGYRITTQKQRKHTPHMNVKNGSGSYVERSLMSALDAAMHPQNLLTQADLIPPPDDGLNSYSCMSVEPR
jgi:hypothetical protein